jgi:capsular polysaccharide biosynthesis protein
MKAEPYYEEEIDLRAIVQTLLKFIWWILGAAILFAAVGFLVSKFVLDETYEARSYVMIVKPSTIVNFQGGIESSPQLPDAKSMTDLTLADDMVDKVQQDPRVTALYKTPVSIYVFRSQLKSTLVGGNQLRLEVSNAEPEHAAVIANVWAEKVASRFNFLFGSGSTEVDQIDGQVEKSLAEWDAEEKALLAFMETNDVEAWRISLEQQKLALGELVTKVENIDVLISDAQTLQARLEDQSYRDPLSVENALSLVVLNQQAIEQGENLQIQLSAETVGSQEMSVGDARDSLAAFISALELQKEELGNTVSDKSSKITYLSARYESGRYELDQLTLKRDLSKQAYEALSTHAVEVQILSANNDQVAKVAGQALPPVRPSGPKTMINTAIAGIAGLMIAVAVVMVWSWWKPAK